MKTKDIEKEITKIFQKLSKNKNNVAFVFSYSYEEVNGNEPSIEGKLGAWGPKEVIDILLDELKEKKEKKIDKVYSQITT